MQTQEVIDPVTGEITQKAADGRLTLPVSSTFGHLIQTLEYGQLNDDATEKLAELSETLLEFSERYGEKVKVKGKLKLELEFTQQGEVTYIRATKLDTVLPNEGRKNTIMWALSDGRFSSNPPRQGQLFGVRDATPAAAAEMRDVIPATNPTTFRDAE